MGWSSKYFHQDFQEKTWRLWFFCIWFQFALCEVPVDLIEEAAMMVCAPQINTMATNVAGDFAEKFSVARGFEVGVSIW